VKLLKFALIVILLSMTGCSKIILKKMADGLSGESKGSAFTRDNDPQLMADALPLALKLYETILEKNPKHAGIHGSTASAFCSYSYAFINFPADTLPSEQSDTKFQMHQRAKKMYLRAREYGMMGLEINHPGFREAFKTNTDSALAMMTSKDCKLLYWTGLSWMGAFNTDKFDMKLALSVPKAIKIMKKVEQLDPNYGTGSIDEFLISFYGAMPTSMGGDVAKAKVHFDRAVELTEENSAGPYIAYASAVAIPSQNRELFEELISQALEIKPEDDKDNLLFRTIQNQKAQWYMNHIEDFFVTEETSESSDEPVEEDESIENDTSSSDSTDSKETIEE